MKTKQCLVKAAQGIQQEFSPKLCGEGTSGSYFMKESGENVAVFKPIDEEPYAPNNPRGMKGLFGSATCRDGVKSGELTVREVAAYMLDHENFAGVPATCLVELVHQEMPA